jgi:hypothetical protein
VHGLAEQFHGRLQLESKRNQGTTARLWIPGTDEAVLESAPGENAASVQMAANALRVLAVDDDAP